MPLLPDSAYQSEFFKPTDLGLKLGARKTFTITGPHEKATLTSKGEEKAVYSIPVDLEGAKGKLNLGKTNAKQFVNKLGKNTDDWKGARFDMIVVPVNNPSNGQQTLSWAIDADSIFPAAS